MITAAAIRKDGIVYTDKRHHLIMHSPLRRKGFLKFGEQGFITDKGEFLNREAAAKHAISCGQITSLKYSLRDLFSEDLW